MADQSVSVEYPIVRPFARKHGTVISQGIFGYKGAALERPADCRLGQHGIHELVIHIERDLVAIAPRAEAVGNAYHLVSQSRVTRLRDLIADAQDRPDGIG